MTHICIQGRARFHSSGGFGASTSSIRCRDTSSSRRKSIFLRLKFELILQRCEITMGHLQRKDVTKRDPRTQSRATGRLTRSSGSIEYRRILSPLIVLPSSLFAGRRECEVSKKTCAPRRAMPTLACTSNLRQISLP